MGANLTPEEVAAALEAVRRAVAEAHGHLDPDPEAHRLQIPPEELALRQALEEVEAARRVSAHWPIVAHTPYERLWAWIHKLTRRFLRWYINPIVDQQNAFNEATARALKLLADEVVRLRRTLPSSPADDEAPR